MLEWMCAGTVVVANLPQLRLSAKGAPLPHHTVSEIAALIWILSKVDYEPSCKNLGLHFM